MIIIPGVATSMATATAAITATGNLYCTVLSGSYTNPTSGIHLRHGCVVRIRLACCLLIIQIIEPWHVPVSGSGPISLPLIDGVLSMHEDT